MTPITFHLDRYSAAEQSKLLQGLRLTNGTIPCTAVPCTECAYMTLCHDLMDKVDLISKELRAKEREAAHGTTDA